MGPRVSPPTLRRRGGHRPVVLGREDLRDARSVHDLCSGPTSGVTSEVYRWVSDCREESRGRRPLGGVCPGPLGGVCVRGPWGECVRGPWEKCVRTSGRSGRRESKGR